MSFSISNVSVKFVSAFKDRHYLSKFGEGESHYLVTNELKKKNSYKDRFSPISERISSFAEIETNFSIAKATLDLISVPWSVFV